LRAGNGKLDFGLLFEKGGLMVTKNDDEKEWKKTLVNCLDELNKHKIIGYDIKQFTGQLVLEINLNQGGITDLDVSIKRKYK
jgi:hypothetical protein